MAKDSRLIAVVSMDPDTSVVIEFLRGASRGPRDPDVKLAEMLPTLERQAEKRTLFQALEQLVHDADSH